MADAKQPGSESAAEKARPTAVEAGTRNASRSALADKPRADRPNAGEGGAPAGQPVPPVSVGQGAPPRRMAKPAETKDRELPVQKIKVAPKQDTTTTGGSASASPSIAQTEENPMDVNNSIKDAVNGAQEKTSEAFTKTSAAAAEYSDFAKGNVEAFVESGKILAAGLQELSNRLVADSKVAFDTAAADVKALSSVKSPTDFLKLQSELARRNFDTAIAYSTKTGEAMVKLTSDAFMPLSNRVSLAVEKVRKAA